MSTVENKKIAVLILGKRNSGKSTTWYELFGRRLRTGWKKLYYNDSDFLDCFLINGSPEERGLKIQDILGHNNLPSIVLCSVQYGGLGLRTIQWFIQNDYLLYVQWLNPGYGGSEEYTDDLEVEKITKPHGLLQMRNAEHLSARTNDIKQFVLKNIPKNSEIDHLTYMFSGPRNEKTGKRLEQHVKSTLEKYGKCYIGKTYNTHQRFYGKEPDEGMDKLIKGHKDDGYKKMYVIFQSNSVADIEHYETRLIMKFEGNLYNLTTESAGSMTEVPPYFLYAVVR